VPHMRVGLRSAVGNRLSRELQASSVKKPQLFSQCITSRDFFGG
jgi:hypothetical protein